MTKKQRSSNFKRSRAATAPAKQKIPTWVWLAGGGVLLVLVIAGLFYLGNQGAAIASSIEGVVVFPDPGRGHENGDLAYAQDVPVGGIHNPEWQNCGIYEEEVRLENGLHSMEHGAVWITYRSDLSVDQINILRSLVRDEQAGTQERWILLSPKDELNDPIVATAWRVQLRLEDASDERLVQFVKRYQRGPFYPEPGATCTFGGIGQPLS